jgi:hypothetical protein
LFLLQTWSAIARFRLCHVSRLLDAYRVTSSCVPVSPVRFETMPGGFSRPRRDRLIKFPSRGNANMNTRSNRSNRDQKRREGKQKREGTRREGISQAGRLGRLGRQKHVMIVGAKFEALWVAFRGCAEYSWMASPGLLRTRGGDIAMTGGNGSQHLRRVHPTKSPIAEAPPLEPETCIWR